MMLRLGTAKENVRAPAEYKFAPDGTNTGVFEGYASCFGNMDSHGDVIEHGAFADSLASHAQNGTMPTLYLEHGPSYAGGDMLPAGVWTSLSEDSQGLHGVGKISALNTDHGKRVLSLMQDGAMKGLSIGYNVPKGGATLGTKAGEPARTLHKVNLIEVSIVSRPSNGQATISQVKAALLEGDLPTLREFEESLREQGFSRSQAEMIATKGYKSLLHRDDVDPSEAAAVKAALRNLTLPSFR